MSNTVTLHRLSTTSQLPPLVYRGRVSTSSLNNIAIFHILIFNTGLPFLFQPGVQHCNSTPITDHITVTPLVYRGRVSTSSLHNIAIFHILIFNAGLPFCFQLGVQHCNPTPTIDHITVTPLVYRGRVSTSSLNNIAIFHILIFNTGLPFWFHLGVQYCISTPTIDHITVTPLGLQRAGLYFVME